MTSQAVCTRLLSCVLAFHLAKPTISSHEAQTDHGQLSRHSLRFYVLSFLCPSSHDAYWHVQFRCCHQHQRQCRQHQQPEHDSFSCHGHRRHHRTISISMSTAKHMIISLHQDAPTCLPAEETSWTASWSLDHPSFGSASGLGVLFGYTYSPESLPGC